MGKGESTRPNLAIHGFGQGKAKKSGHGQKQARKANFDPKVIVATEFFVFVPPTDPANKLPPPPYSSSIAPSPLWLATHNKKFVCVGDVGRRRRPRRGQGWRDWGRGGKRGFLLEGCFPALPNIEPEPLTPNGGDIILNDDEGTGRSLDSRGGEKGGPMHFCSPHTTNPFVSAAAWAR